MPERSDLDTMINMPWHRIEKRACFTCGVVKPVTDYCRNDRKYKIKKYLGVSINCFQCIVDSAKKDFSAVNFNFETNKYEIINFKSEEEILMFYDNKKFKYDYKK